MAAKDRAPIRSLALPEMSILFPACAKIRVRLHAHTRSLRPPGFSPCANSVGRLDVEFLSRGAGKTPGEFFLRREQGYPVRAARGESALAFDKSFTIQEMQIAPCLA